MDRYHHSRLADHLLDCLPSAHRGQFRYRRLVWLTGVSSSVPVLQARPRSLNQAGRDRRGRSLRAAREEEDHRHEIFEGFELQIPRFESGDCHVMEHLRQCLEQCLGDALLGVLFVIALTFIASSETPIVQVQARRFDVGPRRRATRGERRDVHAVTCCRKCRFCEQRGVTDGEGTSSDSLELRTRATDSRMSRS